VSDLKRIVELAELLAQQKARVDDLSSQLSDAKEAFRRTETEDLPELMRELGMRSLALSDGSAVSVVDDVDCGITEARRADAHNWLIANGFGGLIKTEVVSSFERGAQEEAEEFCEQVAAMTGRVPEVVARVHPSTLKSFIKEQLEKGTAVPCDLFGIRPYSKAKITPPKKKGEK
jgi:hypothetical protein